jgi:isopenicillin-N epimerase
VREHWTLDPDIVYLNHGAFGACPRPVLAAQSRFRAELESEPVRFFGRLLESELDAARETVAAWVRAKPENFAFVRNSTSGVSAVLRAAELGPGDAVLTTDHAYGACRNALDFIAEKSGAEVVVARIPLPLRDPGDVIERILDATTSKVKLALVDHVTSPTGLVFPIETIVSKLRERGIETLVDGAHAPGMLDLDVERIGAGYYVGNFHKWTCAPKGAAMLCVREDLQAGLHPSVISHGYGSRSTRSQFLEEFDWIGSDDPSSWLAVPDAISFIGSLLPGGWPEVRSRNRALAREARRLLGEALGVEPPAPEGMIESLAALPIPDGPAEAPISGYVEPLRVALLEKHRIEVPVFTWPTAPHRLIRISAHLYNSIGEYQRLAEALRLELGR